jgi:hypothetical protein
MFKIPWFAAGAVVLLAGGIELALSARSAEVRAGANGDGARPTTPQYNDAGKKLLAAAKQIWEETSSEFEFERVTLADVYMWSRRLSEAERIAARDKQGELDALTGHWKRMRTLHNKIQPLFDAAARGGEAHKLHATSFYVAEVELWLVDAGGRVPGDED